MILKAKKKKLNIKIQANLEPDSRLLIWYVEQDLLLGYDFSAGQTIQPISENGSGKSVENK